MGATGSGKSSVRIRNARSVHILICRLIQFIGVASGSQLPVGMGLESCTAEVQLSNEFIVDGRRVILIDTPGFDDTNISDAETLNRIAVFLATS